MDNVLPINPTIIPEGYARLNVTYNQSNGDLPDPVLVDATDDEVRRMVAEAIDAGSIPGIVAIPGTPTSARIADFVVERFNPTEARPQNLIQLRPKTPFGLT